MKKKAEINEKTPGRLKSEREAGGYTQDEVAGWLRITTPAYNKKENGKVGCVLEEFMILADLYHVSVAYLQGKTDYRTEEERVNAEIKDDALKCLSLVNNSKPFWRFLGVSVRYEGNEEPYDIETDEPIPPEKWEPRDHEIDPDEPLDPGKQCGPVVGGESYTMAAPSGSNVGRRIVGRHLSVRAGGKWYDIDPERWSSVLEIAKSAALGALKAACSEFVQTEESAP